MSLPAQLLKEADVEFRGRTDISKALWPSVQVGMEWLFTRLLEMSERDLGRIKMERKPELIAYQQALIETYREEMQVQDAALLKAREEIGERNETAKRLGRLLFEEKVNLQKERSKCERLERAIEVICRTVEKEYPFIRDIQRQALSGEAE